jgi:DNA-binding MarR family transcriptional regulator
VIDPDDHQAPLAARLIVLSKRINAEVARGFAPLGLHPGQDRLLSELWREDGQSQSKLIARLDVEPPTVTGTVQRLERDGFVRREPDPANRRISRVFLTERGRAAEAPVREVLERVDRELAAPLSAGERERLEALLDRMLT